MKKKFIDGLNTAVFTTRFVLEKQTNISYIYHYEEDGAWEFQGRENSKEADLRIVSLDEIIMIDDSVIEVSDLPLGYFAYRENSISPWKTAKIK